MVKGRENTIRYSGRKQRRASIPRAGIYDSQPSAIGRPQTPSGPSARNSFHPPDISRGFRSMSSNRAASRLRRNIPAPAATHSCPRRSTMIDQTSASPEASALLKPSSGPTRCQRPPSNPSSFAVPTQTASGGILSQRGDGSSGRPRLRRRSRECFPRDDADTASTVADPQPTVTRRQEADDVDDGFASARGRLVELEPDAIEAEQARRFRPAREIHPTSVQWH